MSISGSKHGQINLLSPEKLMKNLGQFHPLHLPPPTPLLLRPESEHSDEELQELRSRRRAQYWPCSHCAFLLGFCHLIAGVTLLFFDIFTNQITHTPFAISASLFFIVDAILSFIALRRVDKAAQSLLLFFTFVSLGVCVVIFLQSAIIVNAACETPDGCYALYVVLFSFLLCLSLIEGTVCMTTMLVCFRSLSEAYFVPRPNSPYSTLIVGDYLSLKKEPHQIFKKHHDTMVGSLLA